jgi:hypothetical protein
MIVFAIIGSKALLLLYLWLAGAIVSSYLSDRKGYGERPGLITGLLLSAVGAIIWLIWPAKAESRWKIQGPIPRRGQQKTVAEARAEHEATAGPFET